MSTQATETKIAVMAEQLKNVDLKMTKLEKTVEEGFAKVQETIAINREADSHNFVSRSEFGPVKNIVYGLVGLILVAVVGAIVGLVLTQP